MTTPYCQINIPGPPGDDGDPGLDGADGTAAVTQLSAAFTMPAELASATASVDSSEGFAVGEPVWVETLGVLVITAKPTTTQLTLQNVKSTVANVYMTNAAAGTIAPIDAMVVPSGLQGPNGVNGTGGIPTTDPVLFTVAPTNPIGADAQVMHGTSGGISGLMRWNNTSDEVELLADPLPIANGGTAAATAAAARTSLGAAPSDATYITQTASAGLSAEQALSALATGYVKVTTATGVLSSQAVPIPVADGGTGGITAGAARTALGTAASGANTDITSLAGLTTALTKVQGGTGAKEMPAFRAHRNGVTQTITASGVIDQIAFNTESFDTNANYDTGSYRFTPTITGYYTLHACVRFSGLTALDAVTIYIYKNGSAIAQHHLHVGDTDDSASVSVSAVANGTTDYFDARVAQSNAAGKDITGLAIECWFEGHWIA